MGDLHKARSSSKRCLATRITWVRTARSWPPDPASGQLPAGLHAPGADQRCLRSGSAAFGRWPHRLTIRPRPTNVCVSAGPGPGSRFGTMGGVRSERRLYLVDLDSHQSRFQPPSPCAAVRLDRSVSYSSRLAKRHHPTRLHWTTSVRAHIDEAPLRASRSGAKPWTVDFLLRPRSVEARVPHALTSGYPADSRPLSPGRSR